MPVLITADGVGLFVHSAENTVSGIGFGKSVTEFFYTPDMAVSKIGAGADFLGKNSRVSELTERTA